MKKKLLTIALCVAMALSLCACGAKKDPVIKSQKTIQYDYSTGEETYVTENEYDEKGREIYCKTTSYGEVMNEYEIEWEEDGNTAVGTYIVDGEEIEQRQEIEYDKDGNAVETKIYNGDELTSKTTKEYENGKLVESKQTTYMSGEPYNVIEQEYDEYEHVVKMSATMNGELMYEYEFEYEYDKDGNILEETMILIQNGIETETEVEVEYDKNGHMESAEYDNGMYVEYECDDDGNILETKQYNADDVLTYKMIREYYED